MGCATTWHQFPENKTFPPAPWQSPRDRYAAPLLEQIGERAIENGPLCACARTNRIITRSVSPLCRTVDRVLPATRSINNRCLSHDIYTILPRELNAPLLVFAEEERCSRDHGLSLDASAKEFSNSRVEERLDGPVIDAMLKHHDRANVCVCVLYAHSRQRVLESYYRGR